MFWNSDGFIVNLQTSSQNCMKILFHNDEFKLSKATLINKNIQNEATWQLRKSPEAMKRPQGLLIRRTCFFLASEPDSLRWIPVRVGIRVGKRNIQIETSCHVGAKFALLRRSFIPVEQKSVIRPLPSSFPTAIRSAGSAVGFWTKTKRKYLKWSHLTTCRKRHIACG